MSSYAEFEVPVIGEHLEVCANGDKSLWKRRQRKSLFTCKIKLNNSKFHNFCYNKDNYLKFSALCIFYQKKNTCKVSIK